MRPVPGIWHEIEYDWHESYYDGSRILPRGWEDWPGKEYWKKSRSREMDARMVARGGGEKR
jgi:hypothetical protein